MRITYKSKPTDPVYPIMEGSSPMAKKFNRAQKDIWATGNIKKVDYEQVSTVILEILVEDYNQRQLALKKIKK